MTALHNFDFIAILKLMPNKIKDYNMKFGMQNFVTNFEEDSKIWIFWNDNVRIEVVSVSSQSCNLKVLFREKTWLASIVYAKCNVPLRRELWLTYLPFVESTTYPGLLAVISTRSFLWTRKQDTPLSTNNLWRSSHISTLNRGSGVPICPDPNLHGLKD